MSGGTGASTAPAALRPFGNDELGDLLASFQFLQAQNQRMANGLSTRLGIGLTDLRVLLYVHRYPDATPKEVAAQLEQTSGSITALIDRLERSGHITRTPHPTDRRSLLLHLTSSGDGVVESVRDAYRGAFSGMFAPDELGRVAETLRALGGALDGALDGAALIEAAPSS